MRQKQARFWFVLVLCISTAFCVLAYATPTEPPSWEFQGRITDLKGQPIRGAHLLQFRLFNSAVGGKEVWRTSRYVRTDAGRFMVSISEEDAMPSPLSFPNGFSFRVASAAGSIFRISGLEVRSSDYTEPSPKARTLDVDELRVRLGIDPYSESLRDSLKDVPPAKRKERMDRIERVLKKEVQRLEQRLKKHQRRK